MFKKIFSFSGRVRRMEYWLTGILVGILNALIWITLLAGVGLDSTGATGGGGGTVIGIIIAAIIYIVTIWIELAVTVKRFHDTDKSGWMILIFLIPLVNIFFAFYLLFADGTVGPNRYGPDPKNRMPYVMQQPVNINIQNVQQNQQPQQAPTTTPTQEQPKIEQK